MKNARTHYSLIFGVTPPISISYVENKKKVNNTPSSASDRLQYVDIDNDNDCNNNSDNDEDIANGSEDGGVDNDASPH